VVVEGRVGWQARAQDRINRVGEPRGDAVTLHRVGDSLGPLRPPLDVDLARLGEQFIQAGEVVRGGREGTLGAGRHRTVGHGSRALITDDLRRGLDDRPPALSTLGLARHHPCHRHLDSLLLDVSILAFRHPTPM